MNEEPIKIQTPVDPVSNLNSAPPIKQNILQNIWAKLPQKLKDILIRFHRNKKVFWLITSAFGFIFLTIIIGLIFGPGDNAIKPTKVIPTPTSQTEASSIPEPKDALMEADDRLNALKIRINNLDVKQSKLSPPQVNFKVSF